ncbi:MAG: hypothetical protein ACOZNI_16590 [Myxococcota bacterium]
MAHPAVVARFHALIADPAEADVLLGGLLRRFVAVADRGLRRTVLIEAIGALDDGSLLGVLHRVDRRAEEGDATCRWLATELAITPSVLHELPYERTLELYGAARAAGEDRVARRFLGARHDPDLPRPPDANPHLDVSAGERTAAARGRDRMKLDRLLHDRDVRVIAALLDNPLITERDAVKIAAMRPTTGEILERLAAHARWGQRYRVRKAIAFNPHAPSPLARAILPTLLRQHLVELSDSQVMPEELRADVTGLLKR